MSNGTDGDYEVGYGRPPKASRFKKGEPSANRKGRPQKVITTQTLKQEVAEGLIAELRKAVYVMENGKRRRRTKLAVALANITNAAAKGDLKNFAAICGQLDAIEVHEKSKPKPSPSMSNLTAEEAAKAYLAYVKGE